MNKDCSEPDARKNQLLDVAVLKSFVGENTKVERRSVDIRPLKVFAREELPRNLVLRGFLLEEQDELRPEEFLSHLSAWLLLFRIGDGRHGRRSDE